MLQTEEMHTLESSHRWHVMCSMCACTHNVHCMQAPQPAAPQGTIQPQLRYPESDCDHGEDLPVMVSLQHAKSVHAEAQGVSFQVCGADDMCHGLRTRGTPYQ